MGKSQETFGKKEREKKRLKKKQDKKVKAAERRANATANGDLETMMAYIDENGNIVDEPPDPTKKKVVKAEDIEIGIPKRDAAEEPAEKIGIIEFFNTDKGYGFIKDTNSKEKYFFHIKGVLDDEVKEGNRVNFELEKGLKGMNAVNVMKV